MNSFQTMTRKEITMLQDRMTYIERLVEKISKVVDKFSDRAVYPQTYKPEEPINRPDSSLSKTKKPDDVWSRVLDYVKVYFYSKNSDYRINVIMKLIAGF